MELISRTYLEPDGEPVNGAEGYARVEWKTDENGIWYVEFYNSRGDNIPLEGKNLAMNIKESFDSWSDWMTPKYDIENSTFTLGSVILGKKQIGDSYTCSFEIEFRNVTATQGSEDKKFNFRTQGDTDGQWVGANIWNSCLIFLDEPMENNTKKCVATVTLNEVGENTSRFDFVFRCDNWENGEFRIRNVRVESGSTSTEWNPIP